MKQAFFFRLFFLIMPATLYGFQEKDPNHKTSRYSFGVIPAFAFDSDLGLKYGAVVNIFDFGESKTPPDYIQYLYIRLTNTTKGTLNAQSLLETKTLIKNATVFAEASYFVDQKLDFFGFNGTNAAYHREFLRPSSNLFRSTSYYSHHRNLLRLRLDIQKNIPSSKFRILTGFTFNHFVVSPVPDNHQEPTLFENYVHRGIIRPEEVKGGNISLLSLGLVYDSRNDPCYCTDGKWFEAIFIHSPGFISDQKFTKLILTYRQHASIFNDKLTFSFRISSQQKLSGQIPFYLLPTFFDSRLSQDGIGGAFNLRGVMRNRIAADGFVASNIEIKARILDFNLFRQDFSVILSGFYDNAFVTQPYRINSGNLLPDEAGTYFNPGRQKFHHTLGTGLYFVFNRNNVITVNFGIPTDKQLGSGGLYIGSSLIF